MQTLLKTGKIFEATCEGPFTSLQVNVCADNGKSFPHWEDFSVSFECNGGDAKKNFEDTNALCESLRGKTIKIIVED